MRPGLKLLPFIALAALPGVAHAQGTSIAGLLATGYQLRAVVATAVACSSGRTCPGEALYFEGSPGGGTARLIYRCTVPANATDPTATCVQVR